MCLAIFRGIPLIILQKGWKVGLEMDVTIGLGILTKSLIQNLLILKLGNRCYSKIIKRNVFYSFVVAGLNKKI